MVNISAIVQVYGAQVIEASKQDKTKTLDQLLDELVPGIFQDKVRAFFGDSVDSKSDAVSSQPQA